MTRSLLLALALLLAVPGCGMLSRSPSTAGVTTSAASAADAARAISAYRRSRGLPEVRVDGTLTQVAEHQARAMAAHDSLSHTVAGSFHSRLRQFNTGHTAAAENLSLGARTIDEAMADWKASAGHNKNLLLPEARRIGLVRADAPGPKGRRYWALILAD